MLYWKCMKCCAIWSKVWKLGIRCYFHHMPWWAPLDLFYNTLDLFLTWYRLCTLFQEVHILVPTSCDSSLLSPISPLNGEGGVGTNGETHIKLMAVFTVLGKISNRPIFIPNVFAPISYKVYLQDIHRARVESRSGVWGMRKCEVFTGIYGNSNFYLPAVYSMSISKKNWK